MAETSPDVVIVDGTPRVSSLAIAEHFERGVARCPRLQPKVASGSLCRDQHPASFFCHSISKF